MEVFGVFTFSSPALTDVVVVTEEHGVGSLFTLHQSIT